MGTSWVARLFRQGLVLGMLLLAGEAAGIPRTGSWWNPNESGRGFFIEVRQGFLYVAGYIYDAAGRPTWVSSGGAISDPYRYDGTLLAYRNGQTMFGAYRAPDTAVAIGPVTLSFDDDTHATIAWPGVTIALEYFAYVDEEPRIPEFFVLFPEPFKPQAGWWWNPDESGTGYTIEVQGATASIGAFMYDDAGNPTWYASAGPMTSPTRYDGEWLQFSGGQPLGADYRAPTARSVGRVTVDFDSAETATLTFSDLGAPNATQQWSPTTHNAPRILRARSLQTRAAFAYAQRYKGEYNASSTYVGTDTSFAEKWSYKFEVLWLFDRQYRAPSGIDVAEYLLESTAKVTFKQVWYDAETDCLIDEVATLPGVEGVLRLYSNEMYFIQLNTVGASWIPVTEDCPDDETGNRVRTVHRWPLLTTFTETQYIYRPAAYPTLLNSKSFRTPDYVKKDKVEFRPH